MVTVTRPRGTSDRLVGSFSISPKSVEALREAVLAHFPGADLSCSAKLKDGTEYSVDQVEDLHKLPMGVRRSLREFCIGFRQPYSYNSEHASLSIRFGLGPLIDDVQVSAYSDADHKAALAHSDVKTVLENYRSWYSFIYSRYTFFICIVVVGLLGPQILSSRIGIFSIEYVVASSVTYISVLMMLSFIRSVTFDRYVFYFGEGETRENGKRALRKFLMAAVPVVLGGVGWLLVNKHLFE